MQQFFQAKVYIVLVKITQIKCGTIKPASHIFVFFSRSLFQDLRQLCQTTRTADILNDPKPLSFKNTRKKFQRNFFFPIFFQKDRYYPTITIIASKFQFGIVIYET